MCCHEICPLVNSDDKLVNNNLNVAVVLAAGRSAMELARGSNQMLIGFLRPPSFNIYTHIERVILEGL